MKQNETTFIRHIIRKASFMSVFSLSEEVLFTMSLKRVECSDKMRNKSNQIEINLNKKELG